MAAKPRVHYVDNKLLYTEMVKYLTKLNEAKDLGLDKSEWPRVPEYIGTVIYKIAVRLATKPNFVGYTFKDEMIGDGIENSLLYLHNFNPDKYKNPFAYLTTIIYYAFIRRIKKEQKQQYIKHKSMIESVTMNNLVDMHPDDLSHFTAMDIDLDTDKYKSLVEKFETTKLKSSKKKGIEVFIEEDKEDEQTELTTTDHLPDDRDN